MGKQEVEYFLLIKTSPESYNAHMMALYNPINSNAKDYFFYRFCEMERGWKSQRLFENNSSNFLTVEL